MIFATCSKFFAYIDVPYIYIHTLQDRLFQEIQSVCGSNKFTEENIAQVPYLGAVFHETLRKYSPAPIVPLRFAHEDTEIGGYFIPARSEVVV